MTIAVPPTSPLAYLATAGDPTSRRAAAREALRMVEVDWAPRPVPRAYLDLPRFDDEDESAAWDMAAQVLGAADPYDVDAVGSVKLGDHVGHALTVHDLRVRPLTEVEIAEDPDRTVGAYLVLAISVGGSTEQQVAFTGSPRVIAPLLHAWATGRLPITGQIVEVGRAKGKRSAPLAFVSEQPF